MPTVFKGTFCILSWWVCHKSLLKAGDHLIPYLEATLQLNQCWLGWGQWNIWMGGWGTNTPGCKVGRVAKLSLPLLLALTITAP